MSAVYDPAQRRITVEGRVIHLTPCEYEIMEHLTTGPGNVLARRVFYTLLDDADDPSRTLTMRVRRLRHKIEPVPTQPRYLVGTLYTLRWAGTVVIRRTPDHCCPTCGLPQRMAREGIELLQDAAAMLGAMQRTDSACTIRYCGDVGDEG